MANYYSTYRTNHFRVLDENKYAEIFKRLRGDLGDLFDITVSNNGVKLHGFAGNDTLFWSADPDGEPDYDNVEGFYAELQKILPEDEAFILLESGSEGFRSVTGYATIVTAHSVSTLTMTDIAVETARKMLRDPEYSAEF